METNNPTPGSVISAPIEFPNDLVRAIVTGIQEKKGKNIRILDMTDTFDSVCDYMVIAEGNNSNQLRAMEDSLWDKAFEDTGEKPVYIHFGGGEWIGVDYGDVIVHLLLPEMREFYKIEQLWEDAPTTVVPDLD